MGNMVIVDEDYLDDVGLALQEKLGTTDKYNPSEFGNSIRNIPSGREDNTDIMYIFKIQNGIIVEEVE